LCHARTLHHVRWRDLLRTHPQALLRRGGSQGRRGRFRRTLLRLPDLPSCSGGLRRRRRAQSVGDAEGLFQGAAVRNSRSSFAVWSGFSSVKKCPESTGAPETSVAHFFQVSSGVAAARATPASPHNASIGIVIFLPASTSHLSIS